MCLATTLQPGIPIRRSCIGIVEWVKQSMRANIGGLPQGCGLPLPTNAREFNADSRMLLAVTQ
jgi:hypothetical protein